MQFDECHEGEYRIFVGALDAPGGRGYTAAVVVNRTQPQPGGLPQVAFRDDSVACGYRWESAEEAIAYAMARARDMVRKRSAMLSC
jgi:hypothetical protein